MLPKNPTYTFIQTYTFVNFQRKVPPIRLFPPILLLIFKEISHLYFYSEPSSIRNSRVSSQFLEYLEYTTLPKTPSKHFVSNPGWPFSHERVWPRKSYFHYSVLLVRDHPFKTLANFHDFWPLSHSRRQLSAFLQNAYEGDFLSLSTMTFWPLAHGDTPLPLRHADVWNGWSLSSKTG